MEHRVNIIEVLTIFASKEAQYDLFELNEDLVLKDYLLQQWEDFYLPEQKDFCAQFSEQELDQLRNFTEFYLNRMQFFPAQVSELMKDIYWNSICEYATELLNDLSATRH